MRLTLHTDYSIRVLIYLGIHTDRLATISEIAKSYGISRNHLVKVVHQLSQNGYIETFRGKSGGIRLAHPPENICVGTLVRKTEPIHMVECFDPEGDTCPITSSCIIKGVLESASEAFLMELDKHTIADILGDELELISLL